MTRNLDLDQAALLALADIAWLAPRDAIGLCRGADLVAGIVGRRGVESGECEGRSATGKGVGDERERGDEMDLVRAAGREMGSDSVNVGMTAVETHVTAAKRLFSRSGHHSTLRTGSFGPPTFHFIAHRPTAHSHSRTSPSSAPVMTHIPVGSILTERTRTPFGCRYVTDLVVGNGRNSCGEGKRGKSSLGSLMSSLGFRRSIRGARYRSRHRSNRSCTKLSYAGTWRKVEYLRGTTLPFLSSFSCSLNSCSSSLVQRYSSGGLYDSEWPGGMSLGAGMCIG
jgi:hypothetical protein